MATQLITLNELNNNPIYQPPKEWIDEIDQEEEIIKNDFFNNYPEIHNLINNKKEEMENKELTAYNKFVGDYLRDLLYDEIKTARFLTFKQRYLLKDFCSKKMLLCIEKGFSEHMFNYFYSKNYNRNFEPETPQQSFNTSWDIFNNYIRHHKDNRNIDDLEEDVFRVIDDVLKFSRHMFINDKIKTYQKYNDVVKHNFPRFKKYGLQENGDIDIKKYIDENLKIIEIELIKFLRFMNEKFKTIKTRGIIKSQVNISDLSRRVLKNTDYRRIYQ